MFEKNDMMMSIDTSTPASAIPLESGRHKQEAPNTPNILNEPMLCRIAALFTPGANLAKAMTEGLKELCRLCNADEAAFFSIEADNVLLHRYHWSNKHSCQTMTLFARTSSKNTFPWWREQLKTGLLRIDDCAKLPQEAAEESMALNAHNIQRALAVPLNVDGTYPGFIVIAGGLLPAPACQTLEIASEIIYSAYVRLVVAGLARQSEEKYHAIRREIPGIILQIDQDGILLECDAADPAELPHPPVKVIGKKLEALLPSWLAKQIVEQMSIVLASRGTHKFEYNLPIKDEIRYFEARLVFLNANAILCFIRNIAMQKSAQVESQACKELLDKILVNAPVGILVKAMPDFHYTMCSQAAAAILNLPQEAVINQTDFDIFPKNVAKLCRQNDIDAIVENQTIDSQEVILDHSGRQKYLRTIRVPINQGNSKALLEIAEDITAIKTLTGELSAVEEKYQTLIESLDDHIVLFDFAGNILTANNAFYEIAGYSCEFKSITEHFKYIFPSSAEPLKRMLEMLIIENMTTAEYTIMHSNGQPLNLLAKFVLIKNRENTPDSVLAIIKDITGLKAVHQKLIEAREQADKSDKLKSAFIDIMSHEIRTPMNAIAGFARLMADATGSEQERGDYLNIINQKATELLNLISDIADISKLESKQLEIHKVTLSITQIMDQLYAGFAKTAHSEITLLKNIPAGFGNTSIYTDEMRFVQIFSNLLNNALKFTAKGSIEYGFLPPENNAIKFFVKDAGPGIPPEFKNNIFEPFWQVDDSCSGKLRDTGVKLAICKNLVQLLGGNIWFESEIGHSTIFYFTLPQMEVTNLPPAVALPQTTDWVSGNFNWSGRTVLIVDDNEISLRYLEAILQNTGFKRLRAESGVKAVLMCKEIPAIDIVLMDIQMPGMNGLEATAEIKKFRKNLPVVAQTAHALSNDRQDILAAGCDEYIAKPIKKLDLLKIISMFVPPNSNSCS